MSIVEHLVLMLLAVVFTGMSALLTGQAFTEWLQFAFFGVVAALIVSLALHGLGKLALAFFKW